MTSLHALFCIYDFDYFGSKLSVTFHPVVSADNVTTPSKGSMTAGRQTLNNGPEVLFLNGRHCLEAMRELHAEVDVNWLLRNFLFRLIMREDRVAIIEAEKMKLSILASK